MKSVLITTDFSPQARFTLKYVLNLISHSETAVRILLLNTYLIDFQNSQLEPVQLNDELKSASKQKLEALKLEALSWNQNPHITIEAISHMGSLPNVISNLLQKEKIDLVAMGRDSGNQVGRIAQLLKKFKCPLLMTNNKDEQ